MVVLLLRKSSIGERTITTTSTSAAVLDPLSKVTSLHRHAGESDDERRQFLHDDITTVNRSRRYEEAIWTLNSLQSNASVIERSRRNASNRNISNLALTIKYLGRIGLSVNDLDRLNIIHVSGTKGKGSTCAFCEGILRQHGYKTGFYSSPHVVAARERIRVDGRPLSEETFAAYFWEVYDQLSKKKQRDRDMPAYFKFLTIMAFHVFLKEKVDVAVIEVGIGGQWDCTNVIRKPVVCGVSSLGIDHTEILGSSLAEIAWQKGGIFKSGIPAFTAPQDGDALTVLEDRAKAIGCCLRVSQSVDAHDWKERNVELGLAGKVQLMNAGLAVQLANYWLLFNKSVYQQNDVEESGNRFSQMAPRLEITHQVASGLRNCRWPGRHQVLRSVHSNVTYFLDGAHTPESARTCAEWFFEASDDERSYFRSHSVRRILLFNSTGVRSPESLLLPLLSARFDNALFCPNDGDSVSDQIRVAVTKDESLNRCEQNRTSWLKLQSNDNESNSSLVFPRISAALAWISTDAGQDDIRRHVLVTGSLHLVGGVLSILDPGLVQSENAINTNHKSRDNSGLTNGHRCGAQPVNCRSSTL